MAGSVYDYLRQFLTGPPQAFPEPATGLPQPSVPQLATERRGLPADPAERARYLLNAGITQQGLAQLYRTMALNEIPLMFGGGKGSSVSPVAAAYMSPVLRQGFETILTQAALRTGNEPIARRATASALRSLRIEQGSRPTIEAVKRIGELEPSGNLQQPMIPASRTVYIRPTGIGYEADFSSTPEAAFMITQFGTAIIPLPFARAMSHQQVLDDIAPQLRPEFAVVMGSSREGSSEP